MTTEASAESIEEVIHRMFIRTEIQFSEYSKDRFGNKTKELSEEAQRLAKEDTDQKRKKDQRIWERYAKARKITDLEAVDGRLFVPFDLRVKRFHEEERARNQKEQ